MEYLLASLEYHTAHPFMLVTRNSGDSENDTVLDVLIKLIRVIANMSVNAEVGCGLGGRPLLGTVLLTLLQTINKIKANVVGFWARHVQVPSIFALLSSHNTFIDSVYIYMHGACCRAPTWRNCCWPHWAPHTISHSIR